MMGVLVVLIGVVLIRDGWVEERVMKWMRGVGWLMKKEWEGFLGDVKELKKSWGKKKWGKKEKRGSG